MKRLTKTVLKRPVTTLLVVLSLIFFGVMALINMKLELTPDISMPMLIIQTTYVGASPEDINELVTKKVEDYCATLADVDNITSMSYENYGLTMITYEYGTDMDNAYSQLRKKLDLAKAKLPEDASDPLIFEMNVDQLSAMYLCVNNSAVNNIANYAKSDIVPELEKLSAVASVSVSGGADDYIQIELIPEKLSQYRLDITTVAQLVGAASYTMPAGSTTVGNTNMTISTGVEYMTPESLKRIPITAGGGNIIYLEDIAKVNRRQEKAASIGRYNGEDNVILSIERNQQYTAVDVSRKVKDTLSSLKAKDPNFNYIIVEDSADQILQALKTMFETLIVAVLISFVVLFVFYGDFKASLIVATSIPLAILAALVAMWSMGYSLNIITLGSLVLAVGMMVDNSIVVLESCFRVMEGSPERSFKGYIHAAVNGTGIVIDSILGSTLTTCVVFLPIAFTDGLASQFFQPMGLNIVFCMVASFLSAISIVPLCYTFYKPVEKEIAPAYRAIRLMQGGYRRIMEGLLKHKKAVLITTMLLFLGSIGLVFTMRTSLMPDIDQGQIAVSINLRPNLTIEKQDEILRTIEETVTTDEDIEAYMLSSGGGSILSGGGGSASLTAYLKSDRKKTTKETIELWKEKLERVDNCDITISNSSYTSMMNAGTGFSVMLVNSSYDSLHEVSERIKAQMNNDNRVTGVASSMDNASPIIKIHIDEIAAAAEGFVPAQVSSSVYMLMTGIGADTMEVDGQELDIRIEYPETEFDTLNEVENIRLSSQTGSTVFLRDIAEVTFEDSPKAIQRKDKQYVCEITAQYTKLATTGTKNDLIDTYITPNLVNGTQRSSSTIEKMLTNELTSLYTAIAISIFLIFVVMAAQFESPRFSIMVMTTIPFACIGSFLLMWLFDIDLSMVSLVGFLMLIGTVVNNGILYVDTVNQFRQDGMELEPALIEAGAIRLRPIMMTTLTTVLSMIPMCVFGTGTAALMQGLAIVNVGGLITSTVMALLVLPVYYAVMNGNRKTKTVYAELEDEG
ncbi:MAG: efflux RND transporter permease subunit [Eubacteriales bacterium]|nr:efflux RND transporter permease subunit [Eubacteriales bacterium]